MQHHALAAVGRRKRDRFAAPVRRGIVDLLHLGVEMYLVVSLEAREDLISGIVHGLAALGSSCIDRDGEQRLGRRRARALNATKANRYAARKGICPDGVPKNVRLLIPSAAQQIPGPTFS